jgi:hypothetical protein
LPLKKLESALAALFKQAHESNASIDCTHLREKALHISACLEIANFLASNGWIGRFKRRYNIAYRNLSGESRSVDSETVEDWKNYRLLQEIEGYDLFDINNVDETGLFLVYNLAKLSLFKEIFPWWYKIKTVGYCAHWIQ